MKKNKTKIKTKEIFCDEKGRKLLEIGEIGKGRFRYGIKRYKV